MSAAGTRTRPWIALRYDLRAMPGGPGHGALVGALLDQAAYAERAGLDRVHLSEHHHADDGYLPAPLPLAAAVAARTSRIGIRTSALVLPLHDPVRIAEDAALVDLVSGGRLELTLGAGYREVEFRMLGRGFADRGARLRAGVEFLRRAWTGEPCTFEGRPVLVRPLPARPGGPPLILGGGTPRTARRAAEIADGYDPAVPDLLDVYRAACAELGRAPGICVPRVGPFFLHVSEDPERTRPQLAPHVRHEMRQYAAWAARTDHLGGTPDLPLDAVWEVGSHRVVTPAEAVELVRGLDPEGLLTLNPLAGGLPPELAAESLQLFVEQVLPRLDPVPTEDR